MKRNITLLLAVFISIFELVASHPFVRNFSRNISKAGTQNWDIMQHENDWMYFANNKGLLEFDGSHWTVYPIQNQTPVRSVFFDVQSKRIYAGGYREFGFYARNMNGELIYNSLSDKLNKKDKVFAEIWKVHKLHSMFFFQSDYCIFKLENNHIKKISSDDKINHSSVIENRLIVSGYKNGISYFDGKNLIPFSNAEVLKNKKVCAILPYVNGQLFFVTDFFGIYLFNGKNVVKFKTDIDDFLDKNQVYCAAIKNNQLALGTVQEGLIVKNLIDNSTIHADINTGLQNNTVLSISFDRLNNLWLGLDKGIDYVIINSPINDLVGNSKLIGAGYTSLVYNDKLYLGTNQGLYTMGLTNKTRQIITLIQPVNEIKGQIWNLNVINNHLFCSCDQGLYIISNKKIERIDNLRGVWIVKPLKYRANVLLGIMYNTFFVLKKNGEKWEFSNFLNGFNEIGKDFYEDREGKIWMAHTTNGVYRLTLNDKLDGFSKIIQYNNKNGLPSIRNNSVFLYNNQIVLSTEKGFYQFNPKTNNIEIATWLNLLFGSSAPSTKMYLSPTGDIWSISDNKVMVAYNKGNNKFKVDSVSYYCLNDKLIAGFEHIGFLNDNQIIIATENGFSVADTSKFSKRNSELSKIALINITLTNQRDSLINGYSTEQNKEHYPEFNFVNNSIRFEYVCTEFRNENSTQYCYILENYDKNWSEYSNVNSKEFSKIPPGTYTFRVKAKNLYNMQIVQTSYRFRILPPWYQTTLAIIVYVILSALAIFLLIRFIQYKTEQAARKMEIKKEQEIKEKEKQFQAEAKEKENEIIVLKNQKLQYILRHKSQELASSTMNLIRKNEILQKINHTLIKIDEVIIETPEKNTISKNIRHIQDEIRRNVENDNNWTKFQENFDLVYENYLKRISNQYPHLTHGDKKLCAYLKMDLSSKDIAPLFNTTFQSVEMSRHRLRKKFNLERDVNLKQFLQNF
jgi:membrane protein implicated in regulation of membrane protease activity